MIDVHALKIPIHLADALIRRVVAGMDPERLSRLDRMRSAVEVRRSLLAELLLRALVADRRGGGGQAVRIGRKRYGKPYLRDIPELQIALSHAGQWVVCALDDRPVGVDVEEKRDLPGGFPDEFFSPQERSELGRLEGLRRRNRFYTMWTLKESAGKAVGIGLAPTLAAWTLRYLPGGSIRIEENGVLIPQLFLHSYDLESDYSLAVCGTHPDFAPAPLFHHLDDVIDRFLESGRHA